MRTLSALASSSEKLSSWMTGGGNGFEKSTSIRGDCTADGRGREQGILTGKWGGSDVQGAVQCVM